MFEKNWCYTKYKKKKKNGKYNKIFKQSNKITLSCFWKRNHGLKICGQCVIMRIPKQINKITRRLTVLSKRNYWSLDFSKRNIRRITRSKVMK